MAAGIVALARAEEPQPRPTPTPQPSPSPQQPIRSSIERIAKEMAEENETPCRKAKEEGKPCFPALVEAHRPEYSVKASLQDFVSEERQRWKSRPGPGLLSFDPVCAGKSALKGLKGQNDTYYLYWMKDRSGERPSLRDKPVDPTVPPGPPDVTFELIGKFDGECAAVAAYRKAEREGWPHKAPAP